MKSDVREMRYKLLIQSKKLRMLSSKAKGDKGFDLRKKQEEIYKKWEFYDKLLKTENKEVKNE